MFLRYYWCRCLLTDEFSQRDIYGITGVAAEKEHSFLLFLLRGKFSLMFGTRNEARKKNQFEIGAALQPKGLPSSCGGFI